MTTHLTAKDYARIAKRKRQHPEAQLQRAVAFYLSFALPRDAYWSAVGHGGGGKIRGAQLYLMGVKPGVPDIFILYRSQFVGIELKSENGKLSEAQQRAARKIEEAGGLYYVCRSVDDVIDALARAHIATNTRENVQKFLEHWAKPPRRRRSA